MRKVIKALVFLVCMCGFLYQTFEFLTLYRAYSTMVDIQTYKPKEVESPAFSFCNENRIRRKAFCTENPEDCWWFKNRTEFCSIYPRYCGRDESAAETVLGIPQFRKIQRGNRTREYVQKFGENFKDFMGECKVKTNVESRCKNPVNVSWVDKGYPNNCFTVESLWGLPEAEVKKMPLSGKISLYLKPQPEQYLEYYNLDLVHILFHEVHSLENPFMEGIPIEAGKTYNVYISQRVVERLPAPYETNCVDYLKLWKKNGGYGPLTGKACSEQCIMENMLQANGCVGQSVSYPGNYTICEDENIFPSDDINKKCSLQCKEACREVSYDIIRYEIDYDQSRLCKGDKNCMYKNIFFDFFFHRMEVEKSVHQPRYESVEMFSYIGGYMGMWLGISLVALFDFAETLLALSTYIFRNKKKRTPIHSY